MVHLVGVQVAGAEGINSTSSASLLHDVHVCDS